MPTHRKSERAFSTTELMVSALLLALLATFSAPHLGRWMALVRVNAAASNLVSELQFGRMRAIAENARYRINFDTSGNSYVIQKENGATWQDVNPIQPLPSGINLVAATTNPVFFQSLGTVAAGSTITLRNAQNQTRRITISRSGRINVRKVP